MKVESISLIPFVISSLIFTYIEIFEKQKLNDFTIFIIFVMLFIYPTNLLSGILFVYSGKLILNIYWWIEKVINYFKGPEKQFRHKNRNNNDKGKLTFSFGTTKKQPKKMSFTEGEHENKKAKRTSKSNGNGSNNSINHWNWNKIFKSIEIFLEFIISFALAVIYKIILVAYNFLKFIAFWIYKKLSEFNQDEIEYEPTDESGWSAIGNYGVPLLPAFEMTASINEVLQNNKLLAPKGKTKFLQEIGYFKSSRRGTDKTNCNRTVLSLTETLRDNIPEITAWKATPTTAISISRMIKTKIDTEPKEQHQHWDRLRIAYSTLAKWMNKRKIELERLSNDEVIKSINLSSSMGMQEETIHVIGGTKKFETVKEYIEYKDHSGQYLWQKQVEYFRESLEEEEPMLGIFNTVAKAEKKNKNLDRANRLIWYLPATARIFEAQVFGGLEDVLKKLPYSVSGIPLYDYGEKLADIMQENSRKAICNDISGWDTRVSYGLLCLEANFLRSLTKDESLKKDITNLYRLYANAHVMIARNGSFGDETAIYKLRGQVASGRRTTYVMNTITNTVVSMCAAAYSYGISDYYFEKWMLDCLFAGHTDDFGGKISGDDSVLIFGASKAKLYSQNAHKFLNEIGLPRKNLKPDEESHIFHNIEDINFCSNSFVKVKYGSNQIERWMPVKPVQDIIGKACIMLDNPKDNKTAEAWARVQGLELLVYYHHIPEVKALALALLSCTNKELNLESLTTGWKRLNSDCLKESDPLEIINKCLFGKSTKVHKFRNCEGKVVNKWSDLGELDMKARSRLGLIDDEARKDWYKSIPLKIKELRKTNQDHLYKDWNNCMKEIKDNNEELPFITKMLKTIWDWLF